MQSETENNSTTGIMPNGPGAAAVLAAGFGCFAIGAVSVFADKTPALARMLNFYRPTGPLSGVSTVAIVMWLVCWGVLHSFWQNRNVKVAPIVRIAFVLLAAGMLLTFPPFEDML